EPARPARPARQEERQGGERPEPYGDHPLIVAAPVRGDEPLGRARRVFERLSPPCTPEASGAAWRAGISGPTAPRRHVERPPCRRRPATPAHPLGRPLAWAGAHGRAPA